MGFDKAKAVRAAEKYLSQGKIPAAIQEYRRIVEEDAEDYTALNTLGDLYVRVNQKQEAVQCFRRVAEHYRIQGFAQRAIAVYKKITRVSPDDFHTAMALASIYEQQGLVVEARAQYLVAADICVRAGNMREALEVLRRIADLDPNNTDVRLRLAESYRNEEMPDLAVEAYTDAGERLWARNEHEKALDAFMKALALRPHSHGALHGLICVHTALGTADEAAEVLEDAVRSNPSDTELRAMLARAYVEAENATAAERTISDLVGYDSSCYPLFFDVARLYLQQGNTEQAASLLAQTVELALAGRQEEALLDLLQEVLARDPEQLVALNALVRVYTWQRDDERLRTVLERLADAAELSGDEEGERRALANLIRLLPDEPRYRTRLAALGGPLPDDELPDEASGGINASSEVPTFESFMLGDDTFAAPPPPLTRSDSIPVTDFEWTPQNTGASFADLNDLTDGGSASFGRGASGDTGDMAGAPPSFDDFQEVQFGTPLTEESVPVEDRRAAETGRRAERMLLQELESVDFYIAQGYMDIAVNTLDMLEQQYGSHAEIEARRQLVTSADAPDAEELTAVEYADYAEFGLAEDISAPVVAEDETQAAEEMVTFEMTVAEPVSEPVALETPQFVIEAPQGGELAEPSSASRDGNGNEEPVAPPQGGIDNGLAAIFDEFREELEGPPSAATAEDYETHYNMGLAYREMGLLDQAIEEFQTAADLSAPNDGTPRYLQCCNLLGHCLMEKEMPRAAAIWFRKGLAAPGHTEDEYQALRYELGTAYERMGDIGSAIEVFTEVYGIDISYRGVAGKLRELQAQKASRS